MTRVKALVFAALLAAASPALADSLADSDRAAIQSMIANQIAAFQHDDGAGAYRFASPTIQQIFPTVDDFMAMVKNGYPPVYRPQVGHLRADRGLARRPPPGGLHHRPGRPRLRGALSAPAPARRVVEDQRLHAHPRPEPDDLGLPAGID